MSKTTWRNILIILIVVLIIYFLFFRKNRGTELFTQDASKFNQPNIINSNHSIKYNGDLFQSETSDIDGLLIDKLKCHPDCCGDSWYTPFDGLTSDQIKQAISTGMKGGPYIRTNYTCANGPNGAGCPCVTKEAYLNLANRGQNVWTNEYIEPTLTVGNNTLSISKSIPCDFGNKSVRVNHPKLNDLEMQREPQLLSHVQSYGSSLLQ